jgi:hypothetical protein
VKNPQAEPTISYSNENSQRTSTNTDTKKQKIQPEILIKIQKPEIRKIAHTVSEMELR